LKSIFDSKCASAQMTQMRTIKGIVYKFVIVPFKKEKGKNRHITIKLIFDLHKLFQHTNVKHD
jgi:hypothetical protein